MNLFEGKMRRTFVERGGDRLATASDFPNDNQRQAVSWSDGPLLVLAGPGSGKTRVLTFRIARILRESDGASTLALTFTNKAVVEMRERVEQLLGQRADRVHLCTFHSFAVDILRQHGSHLGLRPDFSLLTQDEDRIAILEDLASKAPRPRPETVRCMTVHGSNGLEFKHVYLIGMAQEVFPSFQALRKGVRSREVEEERRNCFVAITRAERTLTLTRAERYYGYSKAPSQFLDEMGAHAVPLQDVRR